MNKPSLTVDADGAVVSCAKGDLGECGYEPGAKVCGKCGATPSVGEAVVPEDEAMRTSTAEKSLVTNSELAFDRDAARERRMMSLGVKSEEASFQSGFLCGMERKVLTGGSTPCVGCPGGCAPEANLPTLLEIEGLAEEMFGGKVLDSGYGEIADLFLVDMERKDGKVIEVFFDGRTGEVQGWNMLHGDQIGQKSAADPTKVISQDEAADIAVKSIDGTVVYVDADRFELENGKSVDAWAVEIDGTDGKSYDAYVSLDGELLGYDQYELTDDEDEVTDAVALKSDSKMMADPDTDTDDDTDDETAEDGDTDDEMADDEEDMQKGDGKRGKKDAVSDDALRVALAEFEMLVSDEDLD